MKAAARLRSFILVTAGHVDHGKSALAEALTGIRPDRLPEERARGLTIDLGFGHFEMTSGEEPGTTYRFGVIDAPGHEDFVKNMVAGVSAANLALLTVASDDGWMPQTEEHLQILQHLGVRHGVIALTKADLRPDVSTLMRVIRQRLGGTPFANAPIVPTSVADGRGLEELKGLLLGMARSMPPVPDFAKPRLSIDRVFSRKGIGLVVTGTLTGGVIRRGQVLSIQPGDGSVRVRAVQSHGCEVEFNLPGSRTALALADVPPQGVCRGDTLVLPGLGQPGRAVDAFVTRSIRTVPGRRPVRVLQNGALVWVCHGTGSREARLVLGDSKGLQLGDAGWAQLRFREPVYTWLGDRFVLRDAGNQMTLGGGLVLEPTADGRRFRRRGYRDWLDEAGGDLGTAFDIVQALLGRDHALKRPGLLAASPFAAGEVTAAVEQLAAAGHAVLSDGHVIDAIWWQDQQERAQRRIDSEHRLYPERAGLLLTELRRSVAPIAADAGLFPFLLETLARAGYARKGERISREFHRATLPPRLEAACSRVQALFLENPLEPPSRSRLAPDPAGQAALRYLRDQGDIVELSPEIYLPRLAFARLKKTATRHLELHGSATVSELRQALGTTRRILIPLLEKLDRDGVTRRDGDRRRLKVS